MVGFYLLTSIRITLFKSSPQTKFLTAVLSIYLGIWILLLAANSLFIEYRKELLWVSLVSFTLLIWVFTLNSLQLGVLEEFRAKMKYMKSGLTSYKAESLKIKIEKLLTEEKSYLNPNLKIADLSGMLNASENDISQVINAEFNMSFNELINHYRVVEFKSLIEEGNKNHLTLFGVAEECGFQSKSTFNAAFKKATGLTPSEFKTSLKSDPTRSVA